MPASDIKPRSIYWLVLECPCCGRRTRASSLLRAWRARPTPSFDDAETMLTRSTGPGSLTNDRSPLWQLLTSIPDARNRLHVRDLVHDFLRQLESRLTDGARASRDAAHRARWG
jgi:hypothetical protein